MNSDNVSKLCRPAPPWFYRCVGSHSDVTNMLWAFERKQHGAVVKFLRGKKMGTVHAVFDEFAAALQFPYYFGNNWPAFDECLADLSWLPASCYVIAILDSVNVLDEEPAELEQLLQVLERVSVGWSTPIVQGESWDRPAIPFHILFQSTLEDLKRLRPRLQAIADVA